MEASRKPTLREKKFARTRLSLAQATTNHLEAAAFETLSVKALCERVQISEATFFNYFPRKEDLIVYLDHLWTLELNWYGQQAAQQQKGLAVIEALFRYTAIQIQKKPGLMGEILGLVDEAAAQTARVHFLQTDQIVFPQHVSNAVQIVQPLAVRQEVLPTAGHILTVLPGVDARLDVVAEQLQLLHDDGTSQTERRVVRLGITHG